MNNKIYASLEQKRELQLANAEIRNRQHLLNICSCWKKARGSSVSDVGDKKELLMFQGKGLGEVLCDCK